jgi:manganese transport protein
MQDGIAIQDGVPVQGGMSARTVALAQAVIAGRRRGWRPLLAFAGPAIVASVAYTDPGNFATNIQAGAGYGYALLWVVLLANVIAMLFQALSAKLGIVTGESLARHCRDRLPRPVTLSMWGVSEVAAMATDLAEFLGGAIGLSLLLHIPLLVGLGLTGIATYAMLLMGSAGFRPLELLIGGFVLILSLCYMIELVIVPPHWAEAAQGTVVPRLPDAQALSIAVGIIGATIMPHALYLHSALTAHRVPAPTQTARRRILGFSNREVVLALGLAGLVNMAMVAMAAAAFHAGHPEVAEIETAYHTLGPLLGSAAASVFLVALLASGFSASVVGTMAGQSIMQDFLHWRTPLWLRRAVTMLPSFAVVAAGVSATEALIYSQIVLSLALPVPMLALLWLTGSRKVMGSFANGRTVQVLAWAGAAVVIVLNSVLLAHTMGVPVPGLG